MNCMEEGIMPFFTDMKCRDSLSVKRCQGIRGGGYLVYWTDGDVPFFHDIVFTSSFLNAVPKESNFSGAGCRNMLKREILLNSV